MNILVKKQDGSEEGFNKDKLLISIKKNSGSEKVAEDVVKYFEKEKIKETTSDEIFELTKKFLLEKGDKKAFLRYNLPKSIYKLGPEGFAFEKFIAEVFQSYKYNPVHVGQKIQGKCVVHEMDIVATKNNELMTAELKFHNTRSKKSDLKVALYMKARFDDILNSGFYKDKMPRQVIITNTKFTNNAKAYAKCVGMEMIAWNYPEGDNLYDFILRSGVHPITAITCIPNKAKEYFLRKKIVSCYDLMKDNKKMLENNPFIPNDKITEIIEEIKVMCNFSKEERSLGNVD